MPKNDKKSFSVGKVSEPVVFTIDEDEFTAIPANRLPAAAIAKYFQFLNDSKIFDGHDHLFKTVLTEESAKLFFERLESVEKPITVNVMGDVAAWLLGEVYMGSGEDGGESKPA